MSVTGLGTLEEVRDGSKDPPRGRGRVGRSSKRSGTGRGTLREVRDGSGPSGRFGIGQETLGDVQDGSGDPLVGPGQDGGPSGKSETGLGTLE